MPTEELTAAYSALSHIQRKAVEWEGGPLLVLAGPGSGKTRVLTCRIARLLDSSRDENYRILGLTFTNNAADEIRSRVANYVPDQERRVFLGTFHSFCADVLRQHGQYVDVNPDFNIYGQDDDLRKILYDAVSNVKQLSPQLTSYDNRTLPIIHRLKSRLIPPNRAIEAFKDPEMGERIVAVYQAYEAELAKCNALDFNSLILKAYQLFVEFPAMARRYRTVYKYICVDEFQDSNYSQSELIRALTGDGYDNIFVVADDDQIIYQWNGASHKRIDEFISEYSASVIQLPTNYRCPPEIVELANNLIQHNFMRQPGKLPLQAFRPRRGGKTVRLLSTFPDLDSEANAVAKDIGNLHRGHFDSVVVLARNRRLLTVAESALQCENIPAGISRRQDEFESTPLVWLHSTLKLANDKQNRSHLEAVCGAFTQLTGLEVDPENIVTQGKASGLSFIQVWLREVRKTTNSSMVLQAAELTLRCIVESRDFRRFSRVALDWIDKLSEFQNIQEEDPSAEPFARYREERSVWLELMREITESLGDEITLEAFLQELEMRSKESPPRPDTVILMTIHGAKGKEFDHVYLIGLVEDELPSFQSRKKGDDSLEMEEERRNTFVAITRTISTLTLSYADTYRGWPKLPSRFLVEMGASPATTRHNKGI